MLDAFGDLEAQAGAVAARWRGWREAREAVDALRADVARAAAETEELTLRLSELDRLDPREGEETALAEERAVLGAAEKALGTSFWKKLMIPSICSSAISVKIRGGFFRFLRASTVPTTSANGDGSFQRSSVAKRWSTPG